MKRVDNIVIGHKVALTTAFLACLILGSGRSLAAERAQEFRPSSLVVIENKDMDSIRTAKSRFAIMGWTQIFSIDGRAIRLRDLPIPCKAKLTYEPMPYNDPRVIEIRVKEVFPGATANWTAPLPK
jgi:hypothetical protein